VSNPREVAAHSLLPHFTRAEQWRGGQWPLLVSGEGCWVVDDRGKRLLDGLSGLFCVNLGYGRADLSQAAAKQLETLAFASNWATAHPAVIEAAEAIARVAPADLNYTFFVNSGSEAVESAIKFSRQYHFSNGQPRRWKVISRHFSYHGTTLGALSAAGLPKIKVPFEPLLPGFLQVSSTREVTDSKTLMDELEEVIEAEGPETIALFLAEPVQNGGGVLVPSPGYWEGLRELCDRYGILLAADEVICGFGRLGEWFGCQRFGVVPDLLTFAKGATSGYVPVGGLVARQGLVETLWEKAGTFSHGATFGGHPVACSVLSANLAAIEHEAVLENVCGLAPRIETGLKELLARHDCVAEVRGTGFFWALELTNSREENRSLSKEQAQYLVTKGIPDLLYKAELIIRPDDRGGTSLIISPPLVADEVVIELLIERLDMVLSGIEHYLMSEGSAGQASGAGAGAGED